MGVVGYKGRSAEDIIQEDSYLDPTGYIYRSISWADYFVRCDHFPALLYSCIEGRYGIEYLLFEEIVLGTGARLSQEEYERCVKNGSKLKKMIAQLVPDYKKCQEFTRLIVEQTPELPNIVYWCPNELIRTWGELSEYLHWFGAKSETTENPSWRRQAGQRVLKIIEPIWEKASSGGSALMHPDDMKPEIRAVWDDFKDAKIGVESVRFRLNMLKPMLSGNSKPNH